MFTPQIKAPPPFVRSWNGQSAHGAPDRAKLDELFSGFDRFAPVGDGDLQSLCSLAERGPVSALGGVKEWLEECEVFPREEIGQWWFGEFPREEKYSPLSTAEYRGYHANNCPNVATLFPRDLYGTGDRPEGLSGIATGSPDAFLPPDFSS